MASSGDKRSLIGHRLGAYRIESLIGDGAQAAVYLATDETLGRPAAVKIFKSLRNIPELIHEARVVASLSHRNIVNIYAVDLDARVPFMAMEYAPETIHGAVKRTGKLRDSAALRVTRHAAAALDHAHAQGVLHRDVKPSNMLLTSAGELRLADFGLAKIASGIPSGQLVGTPHYIAPEVWLGRGGDERSDVYSLGACLYYMLVGRAPFRGPSVEALRHEHVSAAVSFPEPLRLPVRSAIEDMLAKDPADRPQTAAMVEQRLSEVMRSQRRASRRSSSFDARSAETQLSQRVTETLFLYEPMRTALQDFDAAMLRSPLMLGLEGAHFRTQPLLLGEFVRRRPEHCFVAARIRVEELGLIEKLATDFGVEMTGRPRIYDTLAERMSMTNHALTSSVVQIEVRRTLDTTEGADLRELLTRLEDHQVTVQLACDAISAERIRTVRNLSGDSRVGRWISPPPCTLSDTWPIVRDLVATVPTTALWAFSAKLMIAEVIRVRMHVAPRLMHNIIALSQLLKLPVITSFTCRAAEAIGEHITTLADIPPDWTEPPETWPDESTRVELQALSAEFEALGLVA